MNHTRRPHRNENDHPNHGHHLIVRAAMLIPCSAAFPHPRVRVAGEPFRHASQVSVPPDAKW
jgi:hypothetical protein